MTRATALRPGDHVLLFGRPALVTRVEVLSTLPAYVKLTVSDPSNSDQRAVFKIPADTLVAVSPS